MSPSRKLLLTAAPLALLTGCVAANATMLVPNGTYAPVPETDVTVYLKEEEVPSGCQRVALIHTSGDADWTNENQSITAAKRRAGKIGANAIVLGDFRDPSTGTRIASAIIGISANRKGQMVAYHCGEAAPAAATSTGS